MGGYSPRAQAGLVALLAIRRARAEHQRKTAAAAKAGAAKDATTADAPKKKRGWFG